MITVAGLIIAGLLISLAGLRLIDTYEPATVGFLVHVLGYVFMLEGLGVVWPVTNVPMKVWQRIRRR